MKPLPKALLFFFILSVVLFSVLPAFAAGTEKTDPVLTDRDDFVWGLNMHSNFYAVYATANLEEQVRLAAEMGCKLLRNNFNANDLDYSDQFVQLCTDYGIQVMLEYGGNIRGSGSSEELWEDFEMFKLIVNRYNGKNGHGKIDYIQLDNELDFYFLGLARESFGNGFNVEQYPKDDLARVCNNLKNASAAIREADSDVKIVLNSALEHVGMFHYFRDQGLDYDVIGWDVYSDQSDNYLAQGKNAFGMYDILNEFHKPIMICEANISPREAYDEDVPATWDSLVKLCEDVYSRPNVIGCIFYEMCDQMNFETGEYEPEAHFGFIYADKFGSMTGKKAAYDRFQKICGGQNTKTTAKEQDNGSGESVLSGKTIFAVIGAAIVVIAVAVTVLFIIKKKSGQNPDVKETTE